MGFLSFLFQNDKKREEDFNKSVGKSVNQATSNFNNFLSFLRPAVEAGVRSAANTPAGQISKFARDVAVSTIRAPFQVGYSAAASAGVPGISEKQGDQTVVNPNQNALRRVLLGSETLPTLPKYVEKLGKDTAGIVGAKPDTNTSLAIGAPLAALSFFLAPTKGAAGKAREVIDGLSKASTTASVANKLKNIPGLTTNTINDIAPQIARTTDKKAIGDIIRQSIQSSAPGSSVGNKLFHGSEQGLLKVDNFGNINMANTADDVKNFGQPIAIDTKNLNIRNVKTNDELFNLTNPQAKQKLLDEGIDIVRGPNHSIAINPEKIAQETGSQLRPNQLSQSVDSLVGAADEPKNVTDMAIRSIKEAGISPSPELEKALINVNAAKLDTPKTDFLEAFKAPSKVLSQHFGKAGGDIAYDLQNAARTVEQGRNELSPLLDAAEKTMKKIAKTDTGKKDVSVRIMQALEDRGNASKYLRSDAEKSLFDQAALMFDHFKQQRIDRGLSVVGENYSPRAAVSDALQAPERLLSNVRGTFQKDVTSQFSKKRSAQSAAEEIENSDIVSLMRRYASSQLKEFGYKPAIDNMAENLGKVNPIHLANRDYARKGEQYLQKMITQALNPQSTTAYERGANKLLQTTYKNQLSFNPRFISQNFTQRFLTKGEVSGDAVKLARSLDDETRTALRSGISSGDNPLFSELSGIENSGVKGIKQPGPLNISSKVEMGNISSAFDKGASQAIVDSEAYKQAIKQGHKSAEAAKLALKDPTTKELAVRAGNVRVNTTQFGANLMTKPEFFRETGLWGVIPKSFFKQYGRFQAGMFENISQVMNMKHAREMDVLMRGNPVQTNIVEFKKAAQGLSKASDDVLKAVKRGEITNVSLGDAQAYHRTVGKLVSSLDDEIKRVSQLRGHKTAAQFMKMWAAATGIQFLFSGGGEENVGKSVRNASPVNMPGRIDQAVPFLVPPSLRNLASPDPKARARAITNFIPGVGLVVNRGHDVNNFIKSIERGSE